MRLLDTVSDIQLELKIKLRKKSEYDGLISSAFKYLKTIIKPATFQIPEYLDERMHPLCSFRLKDRGQGAYLRSFEAIGAMFDARYTPELFEVIDKRVKLLHHLIGNGNFQQHEFLAVPYEVLLCENSILLMYDSLGRPLSSMSNVSGIAKLHRLKSSTAAWIK